MMLALAVAWTAHGVQFPPGLVGLNANRDLVLNSGEQRAVLANGVDIVASFNGLSSQMVVQSSVINTQASMIVAQAAVISTQAATMDALKTTTENQRKTLDQQA